MYIIQKYDKQYDNRLFSFLELCLPQSGRRFELNGRHKMYRDIDRFFGYCGCIYGVEAWSRLKAESFYGAGVRIAISAQRACTECTEIRVKMKEVQNAGIS